MTERNEFSIPINFSNKLYTIKTSLIHDKLKISCKDSNSHIYEGEFSLNDLKKISNYFQQNYTIGQIQYYLNTIIVKHRISIEQKDSMLLLIFNLIVDKINIPLLRKNNILNTGFSIYEQETFLTDSNINNYDISQIYNNDLSKKVQDLEAENKKLKKEIELMNSEFSSIINQYKIERDILVNEKKELLKKIQNMQNSNLNNNIHNKSDNKIIELMQKLQIKENELSELKAKIPSNIYKNEKLMPVIFISSDHRIHYAFICKKTDKFNSIENLLYDIYPEYQESENYFTVNGRRVIKSKTFEENNIKYSDVITLNTYDTQ